jgi:hypothetical protein
MSSFVTDIGEMKAAILDKYPWYFNSKYLAAARSMHVQSEYLKAMDIYIMQVEHYQDVQAESITTITEVQVNNAIEQFNRCVNLFKRGYYD